MSVLITNLESSNRKIIQRTGCYSIIEHSRDLSVAPDNVISEYYMEKMNVRRRQVIAEINDGASVVTQAGAMQWTTGSVAATTGVKGIGDFFGKMARGAVTGESAIKPEYTGHGTLVLEPTYKYIIMQNVADWGSTGMVVEDGMFLACDGTVERNVIARSNISSALAGKEGLFNLCLQGSGIAVLESNVPSEELVEVMLDNDVLKIDGHLAVAWSADLSFTVERSGKTLIGSAASGEGLVNVYRGTGKVLMSPVASTSSLFFSTHQVSSKD